MGTELYDKIFGKFRAKTDNKIILFGSIAIVFLFAITVYMVYIAPIGADKLFCIVLIVMFWYSKADYFWFAFFIIVSLYPCGLFTETTFDAARRLPIYSPLPRISFSVLDLFLITALIKAFVKGKSVKYKDILKLKNIVYIFPFILLISFFHGTTLKPFLNGAVRGLFYYTLIYSFPALLYNKKEIYKFMLMFFPFVFFELFSQFYTLNVGEQFVNYFDPGSMNQLYNSITGDIRAVPNGYIILRISYVFAFIFLDNKDKVIPNVYSIIIILVILTSIIISATRSAIGMMLFIFFSYFIFIARKKPNILLQIFIFAVVLISVLDFVNIFNLDNIFSSSYKRFVGAVNVEEGSLKAGDTFDNRISNRLPFLVEKIKESPFVGYGFSDKYFEYFDVHLGGLPVGLLQVGIVGYSFYLIFIFGIFKKCFMYVKKLPKNNTFSNPIKVFIVCFFGYSIVNFTMDPIFVLNTGAFPQDILIHFIITSSFIYFALKEQEVKKIKLKYKLMKVS
jgi:hypothetical protein